MNAAPQLELFRPKADDPNVAWLVDFLARKSDWITARQIMETINPWLPDKLNDRDLRALAEAAAPKVISGQRGYKHTDHATAEEIKAFIATMESQGTKMLARANKVRTYAHAKIG